MSKKVHFDIYMTLSEWLNVLMIHASHHVPAEGRRILAATENFVTEDLATHLQNGVLAEKSERLGSCVW